MDLVLFDIDGTLLRTEGAGRQAMDAAFSAVCGWDRAMDGVYLAGSTDGAILRSAAACRAATWDDAVTPALRDAYLAALAPLLAEPGRVTRCPGVSGVLEALRGRAHVGLLTGNWRDGAALKLGAIGLADAFPFGAFGDDAPERDGLVPVARARARALGLEVRRVVVVGDTPADVACARAGGAVAVAVETGFATTEALHAARPDLLLPDLERGLGWLLALVA